MLGQVIDGLGRPELVAGLLARLDPGLVEALATRAEAAAMDLPVFVSGAVRAFADSADDELWFQLLTVIRKAEDPGLAAVEQILEWVVTERQ